MLTILLNLAIVRLPFFLLNTSFLPTLLGGFTVVIFLSYMALFFKAIKFAAIPAAVAVQPVKQLNQPA